jgi:transcriptional regulator with XRE-family HTH domain
MTTAEQQDAARRKLFAKRVGAELRLMREAGGVSLAFVAEIFGWKKDALSKIERGERQISTFDYLTLLRWYGDLAEPNHPALALAGRLLPPFKASNLPPEDEGGQDRPTPP